MKKIVFTGGPCAGKTTILDFFARLDPTRYLIIPEAATIVFKGGFHPTNFYDDGDKIYWQKEFQRAVINLQESLENFYVY